MYFFIVNPLSCSGRGEKIWIKLEKVLKKKAITYESYLISQPGDARSIAKMLTRNCRDPKVIVVVGGEQILSEVLDGLDISRMISLGYIPLGPGNDFTRSVKLPSTPVKGLKRILSAKNCCLLDYGVLTFGSKAEHRRFAVGAVLGIDGAAGCSVSGQSARGPGSRNYLKRLCRAVAGWKQLILAKSVKGYIILDRVKKIEFNHIYFISVQIHPFVGGGFQFAPMADFSDGRLSVCVVSFESKWKLLSTVISAFFLRKKGRSGVRRFECREAFLHVERPMPVHADGEDCGSWMDIQTECIERKMRMIL
ncbi:MAG: diacylglycerol kinase family lipid kinase [Lachnospiraceae bacterium]|nr:diacylglycerol kinase family lipid kinase [Lachnospiraceae bacterium]